MPPRSQLALPSLPPPPPVGPALSKLLTVTTSDVVGADLTFDGPFAASKRAYVVHAIDDVMVPDAAAEAGIRSLRAAARAGRRLMAA